MADPLLQPFQLKHLTLKNRIVSTSHEPAYSEEALPKLRYQLYHEEKAKGGIGALTFGWASSPDPCPGLRVVILAGRVSKARIASAAALRRFSGLHNNSFKPKPLRGSA